MGVLLCFSFLAVCTQSGAPGAPPGCFLPLLALRKRGAIERCAPTEEARVYMNKRKEENGGIGGWREAKLDSRKLLKRIGAPAVCLPLRVHTHFDGSFFLQPHLSSSTRLYTLEKTPSSMRMWNADRDAICLCNQTAIACKNGLTLSCVCVCTLHTCCYLTLADIFTPAFWS